MENFSQSAIRLAIRTNTSIDYFKNLALLDFLNVAHEIVEVFREQKGGD